jgi:RNA polymerase sigma factor (sigma-70 family)
MIEDAALLRRYAQESSEEAFAEFVRRYFDLVYSAAVRRTNGDTHLAADVSQLVFTSVARNSASLANHAMLEAWLYAATRNAALNALRAEKRRRARESEAHTMHESASSSEVAPDWGQLRPVLDAAIDELDTHDREAVLLRFFQSRPFAEVAATLRTSEDTARKRVERAVEKLHLLLVRRGITSTTAALAVLLTTEGVTAAPASLVANTTAAAMAGAAATGGGALGILAFMNTAKITAGVTGVLAVIAIGFGVHQYAKSRATETSLAAMTQERDGLSARLRGLEKQLETKMTATQVATPATNAADRAKTSEEARITAGSDAAGASEAALDKLVAGNPELQRLYVQQQTIRLRARYGPFYRSVGLTPAQIEQFEKVMAVFAQASIDVPTVAVAQGLQKNDPAVATLMQQALDQKTQDLRAVLGGSSYDELQQYERTRSMRDVATSLASELYYTDTPLTADQADQLTQIVDASRGSQKGPVNWDFIVARAQSKAVLSPPQLAVLAEKKAQIDLGARIYALTKSWRSQTNATGTKGANSASTSPGR